MRSLRVARPWVTGRLGRIGPDLDAAIGSVLIGAAVAIIWVVARSDRAVDVVPILFAAAAICVVGLTRRRAPSLAWLASTAGMFAAASLPIGLAQGADPGTVGLAGWLTWAVPAGLAALVSLWIAAGYATRPERRVDPWATIVAAVLVGWFAIAVVVTVVAVIAGERADPAFTWVDVASIPIAWFRPFLAVLVTLGAIADVREATRRARARLPAGSGTWQLADATVRELVPGQAAAEDARAAEERTRIAGDLHASVVPSLRRAIEEAEGGADPTAVLRHLRAADLELERLMADRWPIVLETFGLVAALEDLAERLEADGSPPITIEVGRSDGRPPASVERAAWRFAQVTLDNAVRHATARSLTVQVAVDGERLRLVVADDGRGFDPAAATRLGARGIADATRRAAEIGAVVRVDTAAGGGTAARFEWPAPPSLRVSRAG